MAVAVVGDVQHDEVFRKLGTAFAGMRTGPTLPLSTAPVPPLVPRMQVAPSPAQQARVIAGGPTVGYDNPDRYVFDVIDAVLGESGRRLERELVDERAIASSAYPFYYALTDVGVWGLSAGCRPSDTEMVLDLMKAEIRSLRDSEVTPSELDEAKAYLRGQRLINRERASDLAEELSDGEVLGTYEMTETYLTRIDAVSAADIQRVARTSMDPDRLTVTILRP
jgi:predicted Zn-dependent peptidase